MAQEIAFYIEGSSYPKPYSKCTVYVDGTAGNQFRKNIDRELSHWRPNQTEEKYKAGTSTQVCFKFLQSHKLKNYDLVVNNHLDVDGVLSVFVLTHPRISLKYQDILIQAAEAGDFWGWADGKSLKIFQDLSLLFKKIRKSSVSMQDAYLQCFTLVLDALKSPYIYSKAEDILMHQHDLVEKEEIHREELNSRLVSYHVPKKTALNQQEKYLRVPKFNEPISDRLAFWPQVRNRLDQEKIHLVSIETEKGIHYDLWYPGYCWADTKGLWNPPGLVPPPRMRGTYTFQWDKLSKGIAELSRDERNGCYWEIFSRVAFLSKRNTRDFPIVMSTLNKQSRTGSRLPLEKVKNTFKLLLG